MQSPMPLTSLDTNSPWSLSNIEARSADLAGPLRAFLETVCAEPRVHARFLNMLSLLEHIGSRKIMTSQARGALGCEVLKHLSEEARHAFFFKRQAERIAGTTLDYTELDTMAPTPAKMYFGRLDAGIAKRLPADIHGEVPYLYVTMIVELRAIWAYNLYQEVLSRSDAGFSLKSVLAEEELHLPQMQSRLHELNEDLSRRVPDFAQLEDSLFRGLWHAMQEAAAPSVH